MKSLYITQAGFELLSSSDHSALASQVGRITDIAPNWVLVVLRKEIKEQDCMEEMPNVNISWDYFTPSQNVVYECA
jgi:hypothetical protein